MVICCSNSSEEPLSFLEKGKQTEWKINEFQGEELFWDSNNYSGGSDNPGDSHFTLITSDICYIPSGSGFVPYFLWWFGTACGEWGEPWLQISFIVAVKLLLLSSLQWVSFSAMMEDLGISLRCYQGIRKRSRSYCRAKSACVLCQPRCVPKRVEGRRESSTWAQLESMDLWSDLWSLIRLD